MARSPRGVAAVVLGLGLGGCPGPRPSAVCADLCAVMTIDCQFAAYPDAASCEQGCLYDASVGGDPYGMYACVTEANCDTPTVIGCARLYGGEP